jgi:lipopolysaccharide transport system permease protein
MISNYRFYDPFSPYRSLLRHLPLVVQMAKRDVVGRYRGSFIGMLWAFVNPLLMLGVYTFVFGVLFKSRWGNMASGHFDYAIVLFAGLNINTLFAECANRAPSLVMDNANFVKKVVFPLEVLPWTLLGSALFHLLISTIVLLLFVLLAYGAIPWTAVFFPVVVAAFMPFTVGLCWLLGSLGVFLRDLKQAMMVITPMLLFLAPIFYSKELIPEAYRKLLYLNPLTLVVEASRDVLIWGRMPSWPALGIYVLVSCLFAWAAFNWFERSRRGFADVL